MEMTPRSFTEASSSTKNTNSKFFPETGLDQSEEEISEVLAETDQEQIEEDPSAEAEQWQTEEEAPAETDQEQTEEEASAETEQEQTEEAQQ